MYTWTKILDKIGVDVVSLDFWLSVAVFLIKIILILVAAKVVIKVASVGIRRVLNHRAIRMEERRALTLSTLLINISRYVVYFFVALVVLEQFGINIATLIAGAGVAGVAIGFGAQTFVKDVITGFFIIFEDQFGVGDTVMINTKEQIKGNVEELGLRISKIRAYTGEIIIIPHSQIQQVTNYSKTNSLAVLDISVAYEEDLQRVFQVLQEIGEQAQREMDSIVSPPQVLGVQTFGAHEVLVRMTADCRPTENFAVARELRRRIKETFDQEGIEIPYPKQINLMANGTMQEAPAPVQVQTTAAPVQIPMPILPLDEQEANKEHDNDKPEPMPNP